MIANALFITIALLTALVFWRMGELKFFIPYKLVLWREYATPSLPTSFTWPLTCLVPPSFSFASSSSRTPGEDSPISHLDKQLHTGGSEVPAPWFEEESD